MFQSNYCCFEVFFCDNLLPPLFYDYKRTAFVNSVTFLRLNGYQFKTSPTDGLRFMEGIATGEVTELQFASWLQVCGHRL